MGTISSLSGCSGIGDGRYHLSIARAIVGSGRRPRHRSERNHRGPRTELSTNGGTVRQPGTAYSFIRPLFVYSLTARSPVHGSSPDDQRLFVALPQPTDHDD